MVQTNTLQVKHSPCFRAKEEIRPFEYQGSMVEVAI